MGNASFPNSTVVGAIPVLLVIAIVAGGSPGSEREFHQQRSDPQRVDVQNGLGRPVLSVVAAKRRRGRGDDDERYSDGVGGCDKWRQHHGA